MQCKYLYSDVCVLAEPSAARNWINASTNTGFQHASGAAASGGSLDGSSLDPLFYFNDPAVLVQVPVSVLLKPGRREVVS